MSIAVICQSCGTVSPDASAGACAFCGGALDPGQAPTLIAQRAADPLIGLRLGDYRVHERIGIGGMGIVYRAVNPMVGNDVAIKVLRPDVIADERELQRFLDEAKAINRVRHPNVVQIFGAGDTPDGRRYLVMELLKGQTLDQRLRRKGRLPTSEVVPILEEVLAALTAVHAAGVVHRDLKPGNVFLVSQADGRPYVKLVDFGLARRADATQVSRVAGTPDYISPEHARGRPPGPPADLYAFGVMGFELLTGQLPFRGKTAVEVMEQHVSAPRPRADELDPMIPASMSVLILRLMEKEPDRRPTTSQVRLELGAAAVELRSAATQVGGYSLRDGPVPMVVGAGRGSSDTEPQLQAQLTGRPRDTPLSPAPEVSADTDKQLAPSSGPSSQTTRDLPRRRHRAVALAAGLLLVVALSVKALLDARTEPAPARLEGRKGLPALSELPAEPADEGAPPAAAPAFAPEAAPTLVVLLEPSRVEPAPDPARAKRPRPRDWRADTRARLERVQKTARDRRLDAWEDQARGLLARVDSVGRAEQRDFDVRVDKLEASVAAATR